MDMVRRQLCKLSNTFTLQHDATVKTDIFNNNNNNNNTNICKAHIVSIRAESEALDNHNPDYLEVMRLRFARDLGHITNVL